MKKDKVSFKLVPRFNFCGYGIKQSKKKAAIYFVFRSLQKLLFILSSLAG